MWDYARPVPHATFGTASDYVLNEGRLGLVLFFVLSGYLLYRPWVSAAASGGGRPRTGAYLIRRVARIVPAYYLALAGSVALLWGAAGTPGVRLPPATALPLFAVFAQNYSPSAVLSLDPPTWTLSIEASFYLVLPIVGLAAMRLGSSRWSQVALPVAMIVAGLTWNGVTGLAEPFDKALPAALPYFGAGMLVAVLASARPIAPRTARWLLVAGIGAVALDGALHEGLVPAGDRAARLGNPAGPSRRRRVRRDRRGCGVRAGAGRLGELERRSSRSARSPTASTCGTCPCSSRCGRLTRCPCI